MKTTNQEKIMPNSSFSAPTVPQGPLLPPDHGRDRPLFLVAAILVFLACIAALGARGAWLAADGWSSDLGSSLTIQVRPRDGFDTEADAIIAAELAGAIPGIASATPHDRSHAEALLAPWLGQDNLPDDLPLPLMVDIVLVADTPPPINALQAALDDAGITASVDDHGRWLTAVRKAAQSAQILAIALMALLGGAAAAVIAFAARASLIARVDVTDALHLCGAEDQYIVTLFQQRFFLLGLKAGAAGAFTAAVVALMVGLGETSADTAFFLPRLAINPFEISLLLLAPILSGLISALSAHLAVSTDLRGRW
jgi:cell division transport system permease protein